MLLPSPGTPGEGRVRAPFEHHIARLPEGSHPDPLPAYREREKNGGPAPRIFRLRQARAGFVPNLLYDLRRNNVTRRSRTIPVLPLLLLIVGCSARPTSVASRSTEPTARQIATTKPSFEGDAGLSLDD